MSGEVPMDIETERRLTNLEADSRHFKEQFTALKGEVHMLARSVDSGFEKMTGSLNTLTIAQSTANATSAGKKDAISLGAHVAYLILAGLAGLIGAILAAYKFTHQIIP